MPQTTPAIRTCTARYAGAAVALLAATLVLVVGPSPALAATGRAYVSTSATDTVSVVDLATNTVVKVIPVGDGPTGVDVSPNGTRAYVVNQSAGTMSVIDTASDTVVATVTVGDNPRAVSVTPDGTRAWVVRNGGISVVDTATDTVVGTGPALSSFSPAVAFSPNGARAYGATDNTMVVVDTATLAVVATRPIGFIPTSVEVSPDGSRVFVSGYGDVRVFDTATNHQVGLFDPPREVTDAVLSPGGTRLYITQYQPGAVIVLDAATLAVIGTVPLQNHPWTIDVSPTGDRVYVGVGPVVSEGLVVIGTATSSVIGLVPMSTPSGVAVTPTTPSPPPAPVIEGATFYTDGTSTRSGVAPGGRVSLFTSSAVPATTYHLVLSRDGCRTVLAVLNASPRYANTSGVIGPTAGNVPAGTPAGRYQVCFLAPVGSGATATGPVTLDIA